MTPRSKAPAAPVPRCFVVGNAALDESYAVTELPNEGESVHAQRIGIGLGGKGANQAIVLARCGLPVTFTAAIGDDARGKAVREALEREPLATNLLTLPDAATDVSIILADGHGGNVVVTTADCAHGLGVSHFASVLDGAKPGDLLMLQGNLTADATAHLMADAAARGMLSVLNPSPVDTAFASLLGLADVVFLNRPEARVLTGTDLAPDEAIQALHDLGVATVVLTLGSAGAMLGHAGAPPVTVPAWPAKVVDPTGAGDTFQGVALAGAVRNARALHPADLANAARAAAITVTRRGTSASFPTQAELADILGTAAR